MKNLLLLFLFLSTCLIGTSASAQSKTINSFIKKQGRLAESEHLDIGGFVLKVAAKLSKDEEVGEVARHLSRLRVMTVPEASRIPAAALTDLRQGVKSERFEDFFYAREGSDRIEVLLREGEEGITDLLLLLQDKEEDSLTLVSVEGLFRFKDLENLSLEFEGSDILGYLARE
jgi:hypothetical protein